MSFSARRQSRAKANSSILEQIPPDVKKYGLILLGIILLYKFVLSKIPFVSSLVSKAQADKDLKSTNLPASASSSPSSSSISQDVIQADATIIYKDGFNLDGGWDSWQEDEDKVMSILRKYDKTTYPMLRAYYLTAYKRDLTSDIGEYMRNSQIQDLKFLGI